VGDVRLAWHLYVSEKSDSSGSLQLTLRLRLGEMILHRPCSHPITKNYHSAHLTEAYALWVRNHAKTDFLMVTCHVQRLLAVAPSAEILQPVSQLHPDTTSSLHCCLSHLSSLKLWLCQEYLSEVASMISSSLLVCARPWTHCHELIAR
jgi:hypothetical protein